ncbi:hypothetical protein UFOVP84_25 [uncultured Caudovirales phage]|uniref:DUF7936 domain-containing protein n=1 Tax=uncultured Caudovirales phage TaxID=2100421 RepID=A0A6J5KWJ0_9CAUD|nr:hypothetical protein UFOVP84_25 [uncultured Caudovirales phage]
MTITTTWSIKQLDCKPQVGSMTDYVVTAHWLLTGTDGTYKDSAYGSVSFTEDANKPNYTPFNELTNEIVVSWVKSTLGDKKVAKLETSIINQINDQITPPIVTPQLPWA